MKLLFEGKGWQIQEEDVEGGGDFVLFAPNGQTYCAVLKASTEGRSDRVVPLFAQALLEVRARSRRERRRPAAVLIWVGDASTALVKKLVQFHREHGEGEALAILSDVPLYVDFPGLEHVADERPRTARRSSHSAPPPLVFSDLAQWMLKLLLAADIGRDDLINAREKSYATATDLAREAGVSVMSATRLINALKEENFIAAGPSLRLVQRHKLAQRWKAAYVKPAVSVPMKFLAPGVPEEQQLRKLLKREDATLGQFTAARTLGVGHVHGAITTLWVQDLAAAEGWRGLRVAQSGERPDLVLRQHPYPQSLLRGRVLHDGLWVSDIIQTWLDVSSDPSRGAEQAAELEHGILANVIGDRA
ncbi:helix-turn-helix domain-containing protein [Paraburkholderia sp. XV]|uniref:helix-turn-helix domain-containing protein n=1 Tax=Paraburkholderia sp. XV TaxID=2831520 RepID=UPI001CD71B2C|nr:helix-turn-helix domain-containing protein [Paraburkholderia sp. XV]